MELPEKILVLMSDSNETVGSDKLAVKFEEDHQKVVGAIKSLESLGDVIKTETETVQCTNTLMVAFLDYFSRCIIGLNLKRLIKYNFCGCTELQS